MILSALRHTANPDAIALVSHLGKGKRTETTYQELLQRADALAEQLRAQGLGPGQFVGIFMRRCAEHVIAMLAAWQCGAAFFSLNPKLTAHQVEHILRISGASLLLVDNAALVRLSQAAPTDNVRWLHYSFEPFTPVQEKILRNLGARATRIMPDDTQPPTPGARWPHNIPQDAALALFTSGSTGQPKGVLISHQDLYLRALAECRAYQLRPEDRMLGLLPFSFDVGLNQLFTALLTGARLILLNSWLPADLCTAVHEYNITCASGVPSIWAEVLRFDQKQAMAALRRLRYLTVSGGDMAPTELQKLRDWSQPAGIYKTYGQSETFRSSMLLPHEFDTKRASVGRPLPHVEILIIDEQGNAQPPGVEGEILHRGMGVMLGYLGDPHGSAAKLRANPCQPQPALHPQTVVYTGDMGKLDEDGYLYVLGRQDGMLKIQGNRVYPKEIQDVLLEHPDIAEAAVVGVYVADEPQLCAQVRPRAGSELSHEALLSFLQRNLPSYMVPARLALIEDFPRTASGKIQLAEVKRFFTENSAE